MERFYHATAIFFYTKRFGMGGNFKSEKRWVNVLVRTNKQHSVGLHAFHTDICIPHLYGSSVKCGDQHGKWAAQRKCANWQHQCSEVAGVHLLSGHYTVLK